MKKCFYQRHNDPIDLENETATWLFGAPYAEPTGKKKKELIYRLEWLITVANGKLNCPYTVGNKEDYFWNPEYFHAQWWRLIENYSKQTKEKVKTLEESDPSEMTVWVTQPGWEPSIT